MSRKRKVVNIDLINDHDEQLAVGGGLAAISRQMEAKHIAPRTISSYRHRIKNVIEWLKENEAEYSDLIFEDDAQTKLKLITVANKDIYQRFFAHLMSNAVARSLLNGPHQLDPEFYPDPYSLSTIEGYRSAIV